MTQPDPSAVRAHYRSLASSYATRENKACKRAYAALAVEHLGRCTRVLEIGCGASSVRHALPGVACFGCDLSPSMIAAGDSRCVVVADGASTPFADGAFDGAVSINVLEHTPSPEAIFREAARILKPGGRFLAVTPNGAMEPVLDVLEWLRLKLPEGPHRFLTPDALRATVPPDLAIEWHDTLLALPLGPAAFVRAVDRVAGRWGLFQALVAQRR